MCTQNKQYSCMKNAQQKRDKKSILLFHHNNHKNKAISGPGKAGQ